MNSNCLKPEASCRCLLSFTFLLRLCPLLSSHLSPLPVCFISERWIPLTLSLSFFPETLTHCIAVRLSRLMQQSISLQQCASSLFLPLQHLWLSTYSIQFSLSLVPSRISFRMKWTGSFLLLSLFPSCIFLVRLTVMLLSLASTQSPVKTGRSLSPIGSKGNYDEKRTVDGNIDSNFLNVFILHRK